MSIFELAVISAFLLIAALVVLSVLCGVLILLGLAPEKGSRLRSWMDAMARSAKVSRTPRRTGRSGRSGGAGGGNFGGGGASGNY
jgi:uncharacterized membrane protein YgcG